MESTRTVTELKSTFIRRQLRILSEALEPSESWRTYAGGDEDLSDRVVEDVVLKRIASYFFPEQTGCC